MQGTIPQQQRRDMTGAHAARVCERALYQNLNQHLIADFKVRGRAQSCSGSHGMQTVNKVSQSLSSFQIF